MSEVTLDSDDAIDRVLNVLRFRMQEAVQEHRRINMTARASCARNTVQEDGGFMFSLNIEPRK